MGNDAFPGGQTRADIEARFQRLSSQLRRIAAQEAASAVRSTVTQFIAKTVSILNYSDLQGIPASFNPSAHAGTHAIAGSDPVSPASIGAYTQAEVDAMRAALDGGVSDSFYLLTVDASAATDGVADGGSA